MVVIVLGALVLSVNVLRSQAVTTSVPPVGSPLEPNVSLLDSVFGSVVRECAPYWRGVTDRRGIDHCRLSQQWRLVRRLAVKVNAGIRYTANLPPGQLVRISQAPHCKSL